MKMTNLAAAFAVLLSLFSTASVFAAEPLNAWRSQAVRKIVGNMTYPRSAVNREIEGRAMVKVIVNDSGEIAEHQIIQATGQAVLDREIPKILERANPLPTLPADAGTVTVMVPLVWALD